MSETTYLFVLPWELGRPGGVDQVVLNLHRCFAEDEEMRAALMIASWDHRDPVEVQESGRVVCRVRLRAPYSRSSGIIGSVRGILSLLGELSRLRRYLAARNVRVVNVHYPSLSALQFGLIKRWWNPKLRIILSFHGMDLASARQSTWVERKLWKLLLSSCDHLVGCSQSLAREIAEVFPEAAAQTRAIHNGLDVELMLQGRDLSFSIDRRLSERAFILSVAAFEPKKGLDVLIRAFKDVRTRSEQDLALVLVGVERGTSPALRKLVEQLELSEHVYFFYDVPHNRLHAFYSAAEIFCLPSRREPFGIVLLEAGAFGRAVVATKVGGIPEVITDGVTGRLVPLDNSEELAQALTQLVRSQADRVRLGTALQRRVKQEFSWARAYHEYLDLCR